jgi:hypothetical protein
MSTNSSAAGLRIFFSEWRYGDAYLCRGRPPALPAGAWGQKAHGGQSRTARQPEPAGNNHPPSRTPSKRSIFELEFEDHPIRQAAFAF